MHASRRPSGGVGSFVSAVVHGVPTAPSTPPSSPTTNGTAGATGTGAGNGNATPPAPAKPKETYYQKAVHWVEEPKHIGARLIRAGLIFLAIIVVLRWGIALALRLLAYTFQPVTDVVGSFWGEPWLLVVLFVVVGLFGTRHASSFWKGLFGTNKSPFDGGEKFMAEVRSKYKHNIVLGIMLGFGAMVFLNPQAEQSILGDWVPEQFWALGNLAVLTQAVLYSLALFIWARKIDGRVVKWPFVVVTGIVFLVTVERFCHLGLNRCPTALHWVYSWADEYTDTDQYEGGMTYEEYLAAGASKQFHNVIGPAKDAQTPVTYWVFELPDERLSRGWGIKGSVQVARGEFKGEADDWASDGWVTLVVSQDLKTVHPIGDLRLRKLADSGPDADRNFERPPSGIWAAIDEATGGSWNWAYLGFMNRDPRTAAEYDLFSYN